MMELEYVMGAEFRDLPEQVNGSPDIDGIVAVSPYSWTGEFGTAIHPMPFLAPELGRALHVPVLIVNILDAALLRAWPQMVLKFPPGFRDHDDGDFSILNILSESWRRMSDEGRPLPLESVSKLIESATARLGIKRSAFIVADPAHARLFTHIEGAQRVYYCTDDFASDDPARAESICEDEHIAVSEADIVLDVSPPLLERDRPAAKRAYLFPNAVDFERTAAEAVRPHEPLVTEQTSRPRIGYVGSLGPRVDFDALLGAVRTHPDKAFLFAGPEEPGNPHDREQLAQLRALKNTTFFGRRSRIDAIHILKTCDIGLIPYKESLPFNQACSPMKLYEYAALGLSVITTRLPAVMHADKIASVVGPESISHAIDIELARRPAYADAMRSFAKEHTWEARARTLRAYFSR